MRIAWVTPYLPEPATSGGAIRQQRLASALAPYCELQLFARGELWERPRARSPELGFFDGTWLGRDYCLSQRRGAQLASRVRRGSPRSLYRALGKANAQAPFDGVVVSHSWAALGAQSLGLPWFLDEHNVESSFFRDLASSRAQHGRGFDVELAALERWEQTAWREARAVTCVSAEDAARVSLYRATSTTFVLQNGADLERFAGQHSATRDGGALFIGSLNHHPNHAAALRLIERIMPRVWNELPWLPLTLVGGPVSGALRRAARNARGPVVVKGRVADVSEDLTTGRVFVNPLLHGAGSSLKSIEALAAGIPLVSTALGARGFGLLPEQHYLRAESDHELASAILHVLRNVDEAASRARRAREHAEQFAWSALGAQFAGHVLSAFDGARL